ncbi:MAG: hypothetical protein ACM3WV_02600 [Bacillota bacterium]
MEKITIYKSDNLNQINDLIHDCFFDIDRITVDNNTFILYFTRYLESRKKPINSWFLFKQYETPGLECILEIHEVKSYSIKDTQKVQFNDLNELAFDQATNMILIRTEIPLSIEIEVLSLKISVVITDKVISSKKVWGF